jgi:hypothetical protein
VVEGCSTETVSLVFVDNPSWATADVSGDLPRGRVASLRISSGASLVLCRSCIRRDLLPLVYAAATSFWGPVAADKLAKETVQVLDCCRLASEAFLFWETVAWVTFRWGFAKCFEQNRVPASGISWDWDCASGSCVGPRETPMATSWATVTRSNDGLATTRVVPAANDSAELKGATGLGPDVVSLVVCSGIPVATVRVDDSAFDWTPNVFAELLVLRQFFVTRSHQHRPADLQFSSTVSVYCSKTGKTN